MPPFRILEHTADIGFEAFGRSREEVFANAARALLSIIVDLDSVEPTQEVGIERAAPDAPSLLVDWLSEILYLYDAEGWLLSKFRFDRLEETKLAARARGEKFHPGRHKVNLLVKAVTYHQLVLEETPEGWRAQVYVDI
jgi:SHS2 domain-containing protein